MRVVNIELYRSEQILDSGVVGITSIDQILVSSSNNNLLKKNSFYKVFPFLN